MISLKLGDYILDPRRAVYVRSLKALVCAGLSDALRIGIVDGLRSVIVRMDSLIDDYQPETLIILGSMSEQSPLEGMARRWGRRVKLQMIANHTEIDTEAKAEILGIEVHHELVWGKYRFVESENTNALEVQFLTFIGSPQYSIKVGKNALDATLGGTKLPVYLKGVGKLFLPSFSPLAVSSSVFIPELERFDVFALGHQRILPLGKVASLKKYKGITKSVPLLKTTLKVTHDARQDSESS